MKSEYATLLDPAGPRASNCLKTVNSTMATTIHTAILENHCLFKPDSNTNAKLGTAMPTVPIWISF